MFDTHGLLLEYIEGGLEKLGDYPGRVHARPSFETIAYYRSFSRCIPRSTGSRGIRNTWRFRTRTCQYICFFSFVLFALVPGHLSIRDETLTPLSLRSLTASIHHCVDKRKSVRRCCPARQLAPDCHSAIRMSTSRIFRGLSTFRVSNVFSPETVFGKRFSNGLSFYFPDCFSSYLRDGCRYAEPTCATRNNIIFYV